MGATWAVSASTALSRVLGVVRVQVMAYYFGAGVAADAFFIAFRIPNLLRDLFAEGALSVAFVPVFKKTLVREGPARAQELGNRAFTLLLWVVAVCTLLGILTAPWWVLATAEGFTNDPYKFALTVSLTRWLFPFLLFVSLAALLMGMLNAYGRFIAPANASSVFNIGMIVGAVAFYPVFDEPVYCLVVGALLGVVGQFLVQLPSLKRAGHRLSLDRNFRDPGLREVGKLLTPMTVGLAASRVNIMISSILASHEGAGAVSYLVYAYQIMHFPLGVFAVAIGTVALPKASEQVARGETDQLGATLRGALRMLVYLVLPSSVYLAFFNETVVRALYERGAFTALDSAGVSITLLWYSVGLLGFAGARVATPIFYALGDAKAPMRFSVQNVILNIALSLLFVRALGMSFAGLAAATALAGIVNLVQLLWTLWRRGIFNRVDSYWENLWKCTLGALAMAVALYLATPYLGLSFTGFTRDASTVIGQVVIGVVVYFAVTSWLGLAEAERVVSRFLALPRALWRRLGR